MNEADERARHFHFAVYLAIFLGLIGVFFVMWGLR